ncbi:type II toxin-antitoxin system RelE family toxin [Nitrosomonas sp.]|uniref:type II toxin-antitoxin system RelE family toxin n=1 Tax=Nitrosomonas sp. TaxID=42353 RepID=UPI001D5D2B1F|nr:type II toxin-antitoxin system RelE/ParE family toxin [Nitrosomonas sp.]MBX3616667.1 type II toxin-antitoxin system RelE/ParE family toxin [Nitrosomonas sp.]
MSYSVSIKQSALKSLKNITYADRIRIIEAIDQLKTNPAAVACSKRISRLRRIRIGLYCVVYEVHDAQLTVLVIRIGHHRDGLSINSFMRTRISIWQIEATHKSEKEI